MDLIFLKLLNMSIAAGWVICAVLLLRFLLKNMPKRICCLLWGITAVRLICPFSLKAPFSLIPSAEVFDADVVQYARKPTIHTGIPFLSRSLNPLISQAFTPASGASANPLHIWMFFAGIVWAAVTVLLLGFWGFRFLRLHAWMREAVPFQTIRPDCLFPEDIRRSIPKGTPLWPFGRLQGIPPGTSISEKLWFCDAAATPFILGLCKPRIYLPSGIGEEALKYVVAHEQTHLRRKDHWWKSLACLLLAVYWFHPLVWAAYFLFCRDLELACDESVICGFDMADRKAYANALVSCSMQHRTVLSCPLAFGETSVKERVDTVLHYRNQPRWMTGLTAAACVVLAFCFLTDPPVSMFSGSRTGNDSELLMDFTQFSAADAQDLTLEAGDILSAVIALDDGRMAVTIQNGDSVVYEDREITASESFEIGIEKSGIYTVEVRGEHARGSVRFVRISQDL